MKRSFNKFATMTTQLSTSLTASQLLITHRIHRPLALIILVLPLLMPLASMRNSLAQADDLFTEFEDAFGPTQSNKQEPPTPSSPQAEASDEAFAEVDGSGPSHELSSQPDIETESAERAPPDKRPVIDLEIQTAMGANQLVILTPIDFPQSVRVVSQIEQLAKTAGDEQVKLWVTFDNKVSNIDQAASGTETCGQGSQFEATLAIARALSGPAGGKLDSTAYINKTLVGHAVLVALACQEIAINPNVELGSAAIDEPNVDRSVLQSYQQIAELRGKFPVAAVTSMLEREAQLFRVETTDGIEKFVNQAQLDVLTQQGEIRRQERLSIPGQLASFRGSAMSKWKWIDSTPKSLDELKALQHVTRVDPMLAPESVDNPTAVLFELRGRITPVDISRCIRTLRDAQRRDGMNICLIAIDSAGGDLEQSTHLAGFLIDLGNEGVRTVAIVEGQATGDAALIVMACQQSYIVENADFGGDGASKFTARQIEEYRTLWQELAKSSGKTGAHFYGVISSDVMLTQFTDATGRAQLAAPELELQELRRAGWNNDPTARPINQIDRAEALSRGWITGTVNSRMDVAAKVGLAELPVARRLSRLERWTAALAGIWWLPYILFMIGMATFTTELTAPGTIFFGFISILCFSGFFWLQFLNGTVESLEIILFCCGLVCITLEVLVVPGFGVFGIGGIILCIGSAVLASQRFVIPITTAQWTTFSWNFLKISLSAAASIFLLLAFSNRLQNSPIFRMLELKPPADEVVILAEPATAENLVGQIGLAITRCAPYGRVNVQGKSYEARTEDAFVPERSEIKVVRVNGRTLIVKAT